MGQRGCLACYVSGALSWRPMARPAGLGKKPSELLSRPLQFRVTPAVELEIKRLAAEENVTEAQICRALISSALGDSAMQITVRESVVMGSSLAREVSRRVFVRVEELAREVVVEIFGEAGEMLESERDADAELDRLADERASLPADEPVSA